MLWKKQFTLKIAFGDIGKVSLSIIKVGIAPFGLAMTPNLSLIIINRFSVFYGGEQAIATYASIGYVMSIIYLILQGVGDGSQPIMSKYYGEKAFDRRRLVLCNVFYDCRVCDKHNFRLSVRMGIRARSFGCSMGYGY